MVVVVRGDSLDPLTDNPGRAVCEHRHAQRRDPGGIRAWPRGGFRPFATNACGVGLRMYGFLLGVYPDAGVGDALSAKPGK